MKQLLLSAFLVLPMLASAQSGSFYEPAHYDSTIVRFSAASTIVSPVRPDSAATPLWQLGNSHKAVLAPDTNAVHGMMTDTTGYYPARANNFFSFIMPYYPNPIVEFSHRYNTTAGHDGGMVEFSIDSGITWTNLSQCSNVITQNIYTASDSITGGEGAFSGTSAGTVISRFQFLNCIGTKTTAGPCFFTFWGVANHLQLRFRFVSDTTADTLSGWMIDSIKVFNPHCIPGSVNDVYAVSALPVTANPSPDGWFTFPVLDEEETFKLEVYNTLGQRVSSQPYRHELNLSTAAPGLYWYTVSNGEQRFSGRLLKQ